MGEIADGSQSIQADAVILATGSSWPNLPLFPIDGTTIITSKEALEIRRIPERLLIVGGGVEGCEFASLYGGLGSKVSIVEMLPRLLPLEDEEVSSLIELSFPITPGINLKIASITTNAADSPPDKIKSPMLNSIIFLESITL